jgi:hemoglobin
VEETFYAQVGGEAFFDRLVDGFYLQVEKSELLRPMYPENLTDAKRHLALFLSQYWGGPTTYNDERGHPRLRMRHQPFRITKRARDEWMSAMTSALDGLRSELTDEQYEELYEYFDLSAKQLRNV